MFRALTAHNGIATHLSDLAAAENALKDEKNRVWLDFENPKKDELEYLEKKLDLHPLILEDISNQRQRTKVEPYENCIFLVVLVSDPASKSRQTNQVNFILGPNFLVTVRNSPLPILDEVWQRVERNPALLTRGTDFTLYNLLDILVDSFFPILNEFDQDIDRVEERVFQDPSPKVLSELIGLKRKLFAFRKTITPLRDALVVLARHDTTLISKRNSPYFRDVYDHTVRITESLDNAREIVSAAMEGYLSSISNNLNAIMKKLTAITAIVMIPTFIAGIYGMNFSDISEYAFGGAKAAFFLMGGSVLLLGGYFRMRGWL